MSMNKKMLVILFACILTFSFASLVFAVECSPKCNTKDEICKPSAGDPIVGVCEKAKLADFFNDETCPGSCSCPGCQITSTDPVTITLTANANLANYRSTTPIVINLNGKRLEAPPNGGVEGKGNCKIVGQTADCEFTGPGTYGAIPIYAGNVKIKDGKIECKGPTPCTVDSVKFFAGATGTIEKETLKNGITGFFVHVTSGQIQLAPNFIGGAGCSGGTILLHNGDKIYTGIVAKVDPEDTYALGAGTLLETAYGETIFASSSPGRYIYYPRGHIGKVDPTCLTGDSECIIFDKDKKLTLTGQGLDVEIYHPPRKGGEITTISFIPNPTSICPAPKPYNPNHRCLVVRQYKEEDRGREDFAVPIGEMRVDSKGEKVFMNGQEIYDPDSVSPFLGIDVTVCTELGACEDNYRFYNSDGNCGRCVGGLPTPPPAAATSFFSSIGRAWGWVTGNEISFKKKTTPPPPPPLTPCTVTGTIERGISYGVERRTFAPEPPPIQHTTLPDGTVVAYQQLTIPPPVDPETGEPTGQPTIVYAVSVGADPNNLGQAQLTYFVILPEGEPTPENLNSYISAAVKFRETQTAIEETQELLRKRRTDIQGLITNPGGYPVNPRNSDSGQREGIINLANKLDSGYTYVIIYREDEYRGRVAVGISITGPDGQSKQYSLTAGLQDAIDRLNAESIRIEAQLAEEEDKLEKAREEIRPPPTVMTSFVMREKTRKRPPTQEEKDCESINQYFSNYNLCCNACPGRYNANRLSSEEYGRLVGLCKIRCKNTYTNQMASYTNKCKTAPRADIGYC